MALPRFALLERVAVVFRYGPDGSRLTKQVGQCAQAAPCAVAPENAAPTVTLGADYERDPAGKLTKMVTPLALKQREAR